MNINDMVTQYVAFRRTLGERCRTNEYLLRAFCRAVGVRRAINRVRLNEVVEFLNGTGPVTRAWHAKYFALKGFFRFAVSRGDLRTAPLTVTDISADRLRQFLIDLEEKRRCVVATRNQRLAAIHALARFIGLHAPELVEWCGQIRTVPFKKAPHVLVTYLEKPEMDALLTSPDMTTAQGRRDHALLLFMYNAGARADETAQVRIGDLTLPQVPDRDLASVLIRGKGNKPRRCPLWAQTVRELSALVQAREAGEHVFLNRCGHPVTRFGIHTLVERSVVRASKEVPSLAGKRVSPHTIRHTTATHLLRSGVDINTIRAWLGHVSLETTNVYAEVDLEMKAKALASCEVKEESLKKPWRGDKGLMEFLRTL